MQITLVVIAGHSRSKNGVAEPVIAPRKARTRWLAYDPAIHLNSDAAAKMDHRVTPGDDDQLGAIAT